MEKFFSECKELSLECEVYLDKELDNLVPNGSYSDGNICYTIINGVITFISNCPKPTTTTTTTTTAAPTTTTTTTAAPTTTTTTTAAPIPLIINWELLELFNEIYVDANFRLYINNATGLSVFGNDKGKITVNYGDQIRIQYFHLKYNGVTGGIIPKNISNPKIELLINNVVVESNNIKIIDSSVSPVITDPITKNYEFEIKNNTDIFIRGIADLLQKETPTPTPTPTESPISSEFYLSAGKSNSKGHCEADYLATISIYVEGTINTVSEILNLIAYSDSALTKKFNGGSFYYFIDKNKNTSTQNLLNNQSRYPVIQINSFGNIDDIQDVNCSEGESSSNF